jgi:riboflavin kinase/FMN adenylyltransferase
MAIPGNGIYAAWAHVGETRAMAAISIGTRPTFDETERLIEAFLLDFEGDLYDRELRLEFVQHLRDEAKFDTVQALQEQIDRDVEQTSAVLQATQPSPG